MGCLYVQEQLVSRFVKFYQMMTNSENVVVNAIAIRANKYVSTTLGKNVAFVRQTYEYSFAGSSKSFKADMYEKLHNDVCFSDGVILRECCLVRDGQRELEGFNREDILGFIDSISLD